MNQTQTVQITVRRPRKARAHLHLVSPATAAEVVIREATPADVEEMHTLLDGFARAGLLLPRAVEEVYRNFREPKDFRAALDELSGEDESKPAASPRK